MNIIETLLSLKNEAFTQEMRDNLIYVADISNGGYYEALPLTVVSCVHDFGTKQSYVEVIEKTPTAVYSVLIYHKSYFAMQLAAMDPVAVRAIFTKPIMQKPAANTMVAVRERFLSKSLQLTYRSYVETQLELYINTQTYTYALNVAGAINDAVSILEAGKPGELAPFELTVDEPLEAFQNRVNDFLMRIDASAEQSSLPDSMDKDVLLGVLRS